MPSEVVPDVLPRLRKAAGEVLTLRAQLTDALVLRDRAVVEAVDNGITQKTVADVAGLTRTRVNAILGNAEMVDYIGM